MLAVTTLISTLGIVEARLESRSKIRFFHEGGRVIGVAVIVSRRAFSIERMQPMRPFGGNSTYTLEREREGE